MNAPNRLPSADGSATPANARFVHLKVHSAYSLLEGALPIPKLAKLAAAYGYSALELTDINNRFPALEGQCPVAEARLRRLKSVGGRARMATTHEGRSRTTGDWFWGLGAARFLIGILLKVKSWTWIQGSGSLRRALN
jgi:hypothetical protein